MLVFMVTAVKTLKIRWYVIGAIFQLCALLGEIPTIYNDRTGIIIKWVVYFVILLITAFIIKIKKKKSNS